MQVQSRTAGFSAIDMLCVVSIMGIVSAMAVFQVEAGRSSVRGDGAARNLIAQLSTARELAISERRNVEVAFPGPNLVSLVRHEVPGGTTTLKTVALESGVEFRLTDGVPDTPDAFGNAVPIDFGPAASVMFGTEGSLTDAAGNPVSGTVFMAIPNQQRSTRAVTVLGPTGRVRGYRWDGAAWRPL